MKIIANTFLIASLLLPIGSAIAGSCDFYSAGFFRNAEAETVRDCLHHGESASGSDSKGMTPLHLAARDSTDPAVISILLEAGVDINSRNVDDRTPLHWAAGYNANPAVIFVLIEAGADIDSQDSKGHAPLHAAATRNSNPAIIDALLKGRFADSGG